MTAPMQSGSCWSCGHPVPAGGEPCPNCGADQAPLSAPIASRGPRPGRPSLEERRAEERRRKLTSVVVLAGGLVLIGGIGIAFAPRTDPAVAPAVSTTPATPPEPDKPADGEKTSGMPTPEAVAPLELLARAKAAAVAWKADPILVSIAAHPVVGGKVDLTSGGTIDFVYSVPSGGGFGRGARVEPKGFHVQATADGLKGSAGPTGRRQASSEPNCSLDEVVSSLTAAGVPADAELALTFEFSKKHERAVWQAKVPGENGSRFVDGWSCNILVR